MPKFDRLIHADWSVDAGKRWAATASRQGRAWRVDAPSLVGPVSSFLDVAFDAGAKSPVLMGFDLPIGVPAAYGARTGLRDFRQWLAALGSGDWATALEVAVQPQDISVHRPFYPAASRKGVRRDELVDGLGVGDFASLLRVCDRRTADRRAACAVFWTLGGSQVGKAALAGWNEVLRPAMARGATLWPFDGDLKTLSQTCGVVLAETYPAGAYGMVGAKFRRRESKRRQADRAGKADAILAWADRSGVVFTSAAAAAVSDGFGAPKAGEDPFDAMLGLLAMIKVVDDPGTEMTERHDEMLGWEGWILGR